MFESKIIKPIFIVGVPRSGTTIMYRILCLHPEVAWFSHEDLQYWITKEKREKLEKDFTIMKESDEKIPKTEESLFIFGPKQRNFIKGTSKLPIEAETFWQECFGRDYITEISEEKKVKVVQIIQKILEKENKKRFLNKSPQNSMRIFALRKIFPDAKFINMVRDPRSVISSMITRMENEGKFETGIPLRKNLKKIDYLKRKLFQNSISFDVINHYSRSYQEITEHLNKFLNEYQNNFKNVFYEELISDPKKILQMVLDFCELKTPSNLNDIVSEISEQKTKSKKILNKEEELKIFKIVQSSIEKMNYPYKPNI